MENDNDLLAKIIFSDEATFHLSRKVNRYNVRIRGSENPHDTLEVERDSPKLKVFCAVSKQTVYGPFIFDGQTVTGRRYLEVLTNWLIPQLAVERHDYLFQPPHWHLAVRTFLNEHLPNRCIGRALGKMTRCSASGPRDHRTWPFVTFSFGGTWRTESKYLHYPQPWMSCRKHHCSCELVRRICCRESGPS